MTRQAAWLAGFVAAALVAAQTPSAARDYGSLYDDSFLVTKVVPYHDGLVSNLDVFMPKLTPDERRRAQGVRIEVPARGPKRGLFEFYSIPNQASCERRQLRPPKRGLFEFYSTPATTPATIVMPAQSIRFLADLTLAYVWLQVNGYTMETVTNYVSMLKYQDASRFDGRFPDPRGALGIPTDAESNPEVDQITGDLYSQALVFILLHELGHVIHCHPGYGPDVPRDTARANEDEADQFALEVLRRGGQPVNGVLFFFLSVAHFVPHRADFADDAEYAAALARDTHPLTADRVRRVSGFIRTHAADFGRLQDNPGRAAQGMRSIADGLDRDVVPVLADVDVQRLMALRGRQATLAGLQPRKK